MRASRLLNHAVVVCWLKVSLLLALNPSFSVAFTTPKLFSSSSSSGSNLVLGTTPIDTETLTVGEEIGTGSYGTVHYCTLEGKRWIGKRALTKEEVAAKSPADTTSKELKEKLDRCQYYWNVEEHCYTKLGGDGGEQTALQIPSLKGVYQDELGLGPWMLFDIVSAPSIELPNTGGAKQDNDASAVAAAPSLTDLMELDHDKQHDETHPHHLYYLQQALGLGTSTTVSLGDTLDVFFLSLLKVLQDVHARRIVHRDIKPGNLLISEDVFLIDFGSAGDLEPNQKKSGIFQKQYVGLEDDNIVAISPIYAAPETFVDRNDKPENFDVFSAGLIYCQLLFNFLDERTDAGFHQQLASCDWNLDIWLQQELASKVRPKGLEEALEVLGERPGLWRLLKEMFRAKPWDRISSKQALRNLERVLSRNDIAQGVEEDGPFFQSVLESTDTCPVFDLEKDEAAAAAEMTQPLSISRPLHFVASFKRNTPLGLILAEANSDEEDDEEMDEQQRQEWQEATRDALPGQVFVKGFIPGGQAEEFGIFEIGDQLQGVGELPLAERGFEKVVDLLGKQPPSSKYVTLHFDRKKTSATAGGDSRAMGSTAMESPIYPEDGGVWSSKGRRKSQEDTFVLHEIQDTTGRSVLVAGVFDGHGGTAASKLAAKSMPDLVTEELFRNKNLAVAEVLEKAWDTVSQDYQQSCSESTCVADYDAREGTLDANTGAEDLIAGTTATVAALDERNGKISVLNCGDSRTLLVDKDGRIVFQSTDHTPEQEMERLKAGKEQGLDYSIPKCSVSRWTLSVGDYQYAVARSLEGPFATSKGIVSMPDVTTLQAEPGYAIISASDGVWEVMDSGEVAHAVASLRARGTSAGDAAKTICSRAIEKGTSDNVSTVVVYLQ